MKKISIFILLSVFAIASSFMIKDSENTDTDLINGEIKSTTYKVDAKSSEVTWLGKKIAYGHNGTVDLKSGMLSFDDGKLKGGSFELNMGTIKCLDLEGSKNTKLVGHLKSDDFFSVAKYPTAKLVITNVKEKSSGGNNYEITGDLTIKGQTHPVTFGANVKADGNKVKAKANFTFDRSKYNVKFQSGSFFENLGDKAIYDDVEMGVNLVAVEANAG